MKAGCREEEPMSQRIGDRSADRAWQIARRGQRRKFTRWRSTSPSPHRRAGRRSAGIAPARSAPRRTAARQAFEERDGAGLSRERRFVPAPGEIKLSCSCRIGPTCASMWRRCSMVWARASTPRRISCSRCAVDRADLCFYTPVPMGRSRPGPRASASRGRRCRCLSGSTWRRLLHL